MTEISPGSQPRVTSQKKYSTLKGVPESKQLVRRSLGEVGSFTYQSLCDPLRGRIFYFATPGVIVASLLNPGLISQIPAGIIIGEIIPTLFFLPIPLSHASMMP